MSLEKKGLGWDEARFECASECGPIPHVFHAEHGDYNEIYEIRCTRCGSHQRVNRHAWLSQLNRDHLRPSKANLTRYPRFEPHSGVVVNSREDEVRVMKAMGMHAAPHGVDERYDDEACDSLRKRRMERERRRREIEEKRRYFGRTKA